MTDEHSFEKERIDQPPEEPRAASKHDARPLIRCTAGKLPQNVDEAEQALCQSGLLIAQRAGMIVRLVRHNQAGASRGAMERPLGAMEIWPVDETWLRTAISTVARIERWDRRLKGGKGDWRPIDAPLYLAKAVLADAGAWPFPVLRAVEVQAPKRVGGVVRVRFKGEGEIVDRVLDFEPDQAEAFSVECRGDHRA